MGSPEIERGRDNGEIKVGRGVDREREVPSLVSLSTDARPTPEDPDGSVAGIGVSA